METTLTAIELSGTVNDDHQLKLDDNLPISVPKRVRVIVLYSPVDEWDEEEWMHAAALSPAFNFLKDPKEEVYTLTDGKPCHDEA
ncbi:MAG: hypothetical protein STSR0009_30980 [Methanoregula sp.]